ncbi:diphthine synthase [Candidatus Bathyarchaeota archaeon]|nr:MAG: diphthine synthase [Candidatus Bathyarchaeota archaeon]
MEVCRREVPLGELIFVGLGLFDEGDISLKGLEAVRGADQVYIELYTSLMGGFSIGRFERFIGRKVTSVSRRVLEDEGGKVILEGAERGRVVLLVPGDPLIATTHIDLRIRAEKRGIRTRIIHGASILSAAIGLSGLQNYRFGKSVTIPFPYKGRISETPYDVIKENKARELHTLCFLDIRAEEERFMTISEALRILLNLEEKRGEETLTDESLAVGIARAGSKDVRVKASYVKELLQYNFGPAPHTLIIPSERLHFMEAEALINLAGAPEEVRGMVR